MKTKLLNLSFGLLALLALTACSLGSKTSALLDQLPADADLVAVGDFKTIMESAGGSLEDAKIKLPPVLSDAMSGKLDDGLDDINDMLKNSGIDIEACAVTMNYSDPCPIVVFALKDADDFVKAIEKDDFDEDEKEDGLVVYKKKTYQSSYDESWKSYSYIAVKGSYAYFVGDVSTTSDYNAPKKLRRLVDDLDDGSYADTPAGDYITSGNAGGVAFKIPRTLRSEMREAGMPAAIADLCGGTFCLKGNVSDEAVELSAKMLDENGKEIDKEKLKDFIDPDARLNPAVLAYLNADEQFVYAATLKGFNWDKYLDAIGTATGLSRSERANVNAIKDYLNKIDGTVAVGIGLTDGLESVYDLALQNHVEKAISYTLVVETKDGKAKSLINDLKDMLTTQQVPFEETGGGFSVALSEDTKIYATAEDNVIVFSNSAISKSGNNPAVATLNPADCYVAAALVFEEKSKLMKDLGLKNSVSLSCIAPTCTEAVLSLKVTGEGPNGVIAKAIKVCLDLAKKGEDIEAQMRERREALYNSYYGEPDYLVGDSTYYAPDTIAASAY